MSQVRAALVVAGVDMRRRMRNRSFLIQAVLGPLVLAVVISLAFGGEGGIDTTVGVVDADGSALSSAFTESVTGADAGGLHFESVESADAARRLVDDGDISGAVVVPAGFADSLTGDDPRDLDVLSTPDAPIGGQIARSVAEGLAGRTNAARLAAATTAASGGDVPAADALADLELPIEIARHSAGEETSPAAYFAPSMGILFLFLTTGMVARGLLEERRTSILARMRSAPVGTSAILAGRCLSTVVLGVASLGVVWAVTASALDADWGAPAGVLALIVATVLAVAAIGGLVAALARTEQAADSFATVVTFVLALIGGNFVAVADMPHALRQLSLLTPNGWALRGFAELSAGRGAPSDVLVHVGVLLGWAIVIGALAVRLLPRRLEAS